MVEELDKWTKCSMCSDYFTEVGSLITSSTLFFPHFVSFFSFPLLYHQRNCLVCKEVYFRYRNNPKHVPVHEKLATREFTKKQISEKVTRKQKQRSFGETSFLQEPQRQCFVLMVVGRRQWCHHSLEYLGDNGENPGPNHNKY